MGRETSLKFPQKIEDLSGDDEKSKSSEDIDLDDGQLS
jgi:hypothetical protein